VENQNPVRKREGGWKYLAVATTLEGAILSGRYSMGSQLPAERKLAAEHGVTVMTVRGALKVLSDKGLIIREQGRGTFVSLPASRKAAQPAIAKPIGLIGLNPELRTGGNAINWQLLMRRLQGIVDAALQLGLPVQTQVDVNGDASFSSLLSRLDRFSGLVLHEESLPEAVLLALHERGVPVVAINCYLGVDYCNRIHVNSRFGASSAVRYLIELGHRRIAIIVGASSHLSMGERLHGYRDALSMAGLPFDPALVVVEPRGWPQDASDAVRHLLALPDRPTAIFAASDYRALGVLDQLGKAGVAVPSAMSVVGFDDISEAERATPPLTTVTNPHYESGRLAAQMLHAQIARGKPEISLHVMECVLRIRASCAGPCPADSAGAAAGGKPS
jgi:ABC-type sugar transport system substrate-binding protein